MPFFSPHHLYCITSRQHAPNNDIFTQVQAMIDGGAKVIQYRDKDVNHEEFKKTALLLQKILHEKKVLFIINDRVEIAALIGADGIHIGQKDREKYGNNVKEVMQTIQTFFHSYHQKSPIIGISTNSLQQAREAEEAGSDYIGIGPIFLTKIKPDNESLGLEKLQHIVENISIPSVAIGGINHLNYKNVLQTGVTGIAMIQAICAPSGNGKGTYQEVKERVGYFLKNF